QDIAAITRIDAPVAINHARAVEIARSQPGGRFGAINRLNRSENDVRTAAFGEERGKPAGRSGFIVVEKSYPIPAGIVEAGIASDGDVSAWSMEKIEVEGIFFRSLCCGIARAPLDAVVRNRKPNPDVRRQSLSRNASDCILDLRTLERAD